jgi:hypothetical protein
VSVRGRAENRPWDLIRFIPAWESESIVACHALFTPLPDSASDAISFRGQRVDIYGFASWCFTVMVLVTVAWPVNMLFLALAVKISKGRSRLDMSLGELFWRSLGGSLGLAFGSLVAMGIAYWLVGSAQVPPGMVHIGLLFLFVLAAIAFLVWILAIDDLGQTLSIFLLYLLLPGLPLLLAGRFLGLWSTLRQSAPWMLPGS